MWAKNLTTQDYCCKCLSRSRSSVEELRIMIQRSEDESVPGHESKETVSQEEKVRGWFYM